MKFRISYQEKYSQGELLLRAFFGFYYILIPHGLVMLFLVIGLIFVRLITFWAILITGKWPKGLFDYQVKLQRYSLRVNARMMNLADGYPAFGLGGTDTNTNFDIQYQEEYSRGTLLIRTIFGGLLVFPHQIVLMFRMIGVMFVNFIAFWAILFTGKYPKGMFDFVVGTIRWQTRVGCYLSYYTDGYPPFTGEELPGEGDDSPIRESNPDLLDDNF